MATVPAPVSFIPARIDSRLPTDQRDNEIRSVPELVEYNARHNPKYIFCVQAGKKVQVGSTGRDLLAVTHMQLKNAILKCSRWVVAHISQLQRPHKDGESGDIVKGPPVALFMESDIGILIHLFSFLGLGIPVALLSARLSPTAVAHLLSQTSATAIIAAPTLKSTAKEALSILKVTEGTGPSLYSPNPYEFYLDNDLIQSNDNICDASHYISKYDRNVLILHSSGTTGLPKPIYISHDCLLGYTTCHDFQSVAEAAGLNATTLPLYHGFGLHSPCLSLSMGQPLVIPSPSMVPTGFSTVELLLHTNASSLMTVPLILEEICLLPDDKGIAAMLPLQYVAFGGGPLKPSIGEKLVAAGVRLLKVYGLTELGPIGTIFNPTADYDWNYFRLRQDMDLELRLIPGSVNEVQQYQLIAHPPGWPVPFEVQDRLVSNPENPLHEFNPVGRTDNLINLVTGEKVLPAILEAKLCESIQVKAAIAFGDGQFELGVIVEPALPLAPKEHGRFKSLIWPIILEAGSQMDNHAKISSKEAIIIVPAGMEIPRSDKGTVRRKDTLQLFEAEIASVYTVLDSSYSGNLLPRLDMNRLEQGIKDLIEKHLDCNWSENGLKYSDDLFELGMDSLQAVRLRRLLLSSLPESDNSCLPVKAPPRDFVYQHPSIASMANYLRKRDETGDLSTRGQDMIEEYVKRYSTGIPGPISDPERFGSKETVVLLTGSTGSLGTYLLAHLSSLTSVAQVICLNRVHPEDMRVQQERAAAAKGAHISEQAWSKIKIIQARSAAPFLGIEKMEYENLQKKITHILHNAWPMDFKRTLPSFESHFQTLKNLINLARDAHEIRPDIQPRLLFISSISVVGQYGRIHCAPAIPEIPMMDSRCANPFGYGQAKLVCEKIIENAANAHCDQIEAGYVRLGQISGSTTTGFWNSDEHFPSLLKSSQHIGRLPRIEGTLSWLPVDRAAESLSELLLSRVKRSGTLIYHLENPIRQSAQGTLAVIASKLGIDGNQFLAMDEWVRQVCEADDESERDSTGVTTRSGAEGDPNPGKRLAQFFSEDFRRMSGGDVVMDTRQARNISGTLARSDVVNEDLIAAYIDHWCKIGFIRQKSQNIDVARS